jgi:hypothetical protein
MRLRTLLVIIAGLSLSSLASPAFSAPFFIFNSDFEQPALTFGFEVFVPTGSTLTGLTSIPDWIVVGPAGAQVAQFNGALQQSDNGINFFFFPQSGMQAVNLAGGMSAGVLQGLPTTAGHQYSLSFWVGNVSDPGGIFGTTSTVDVQVNSSTIFTAVNSLVPPATAPNQQILTWEQFTTTFVAGSGLTGLAFLNGDPSNDAANFLDNITATDLGPVSTVPLPGARHRSRRIGSARLAQEAEG